MLHLGRMTPGDRRGLLETLKCAVVLGIHDTELALWGSWAQSLSVSSISLLIGNSLHSASMTFPEFQWVDSSS